MTDESVPEDPLQAEPEPGKGKGIGFGILAVIGSIIGAAVIIGVIGAVTNIDSGVALAYSPILLIILLVAAGIYWPKLPGFLLGIAITFGGVLAIGTACTALFLVVPA